MVTQRLEVLFPHLRAGNAADDAGEADGSDDRALLLEQLNVRRLAVGHHEQIRSPIPFHLGGRLPDLLPDPLSQRLEREAKMSRTRLGGGDLRHLKLVQSRQWHHHLGICIEGDDADMHRLQRVRILPQRADHDADTVVDRLNRLASHRARGVK